MTTTPNPALHRRATGHVVFLGGDSSRPWLSVSFIRWRFLARPVNRSIKKPAILIAVALIAVSLSACDTVHGVRRPVPVTTLPSIAVVSRAVHHVSGATIQDVSADGVTQFAVRRGAGSA